MNVYTLKEYRDRYHAGKSARTVKRLIQAGGLPTNHYARQTVRNTLIMVTDSNEALHIYFDASVEFAERIKGKTTDEIYEIAAEISINHHLSTTLFFKFHGL